MLNLGSILCPVDYSDQSREALAWAATIAARRGGELTVLSVVEPLLAQAAEARLGVDLTRTDGEPALREFIETTLPNDVRRAFRIRMTLAVGHASEVILQTARRLNAGLIVMGTHGRGGFRKLLLGSTTEHVLQRTEWPVLAVSHGTAEGVGHSNGHITTILMATDFRESAMTATQWAADLAADLGARLVLAHAVEPVALPAQWQVLAADFDGDRLSAAQRMLARLSASLGNAHAAIAASLGHPDDVIPRLADEYAAQLVVMGLANAADEDGHHPGSLAYRVLRTGHVAVLVVPAPAAHGRSNGQSIDHEQGDAGDLAPAGSRHLAARAVAPE